MLHKCIASVLLSAALMFITGPENKRQEHKPMKEETSLYWSEHAPSADGRRVVDFSYSPVIGLSDIDLHPITASTWPMMRSPEPNALARVEVPAVATTAQLADVVKTLREVGKYQQIEVLLQR